MDFFDKFGKKAKEAYKATSDVASKLAKEAKLSTTIATTNSQIKDLYSDVGKIIYLNHNGKLKDADKKDLSKTFAKIDELTKKVNDADTELLKLNDRIKCPKCGKEISSIVQFCPLCGVKIEKEVPSSKTIKKDKKEENKETVKKTLPKANTSIKKDTPNAKPNTKPSAKANTVTKNVTNSKNIKNEKSNTSKKAVNTTKPTTSETSKKDTNKVEKKVEKK